MHSKQRLDYILDALNAGSWEWDLQTEKALLDDRWLEIIGYSAGELDMTSPDTFTSLCHPEDLITSRQQIADLVNGKISRYHCEQRMRHKQGHWVWVLDSGQIFEYDTQGNPIKIIGVRQDISDKKLASEKSRQESERFKTLAYTSSTGAWEWDKNTQQLWCSDEYFSMLGRNKNDYYDIDNSQYNLTDVWLNLLHPDDKERAQHEFARYLAAEDNSMYESEFRLSHADGHWVWILSRGRFLLDSQQKPTHKALGTHINITEHKQHEQEIKQLNSSLEQRVKERTQELNQTLEHLQRTQDELLQNEKLASLGALVAGVAHELNTPIGNAVMVASSLSQSHHHFLKQKEVGLTHTDLNLFVDEVEESSTVIQRNLERADELIKSFKQLAVDQTSYQRREFELKTLMDEICLTLNPSIRKTRVSLITHINDPLIFHSYPGPLGQVIINLINNALTHAFNDNESGEIHLTSQLLDNQWVCIQVKDNGAGISLKNQKKIFDPFFTTKLGQGGSGLGLHITYTLVTGLLGGRIQVESKVSEGSSLILKLPLNAPQSKT